MHGSGSTPGDPAHLNLHPRLFFSLVSRPVVAFSEQLSSALCWRRVEPQLLVLLVGDPQEVWCHGNRKFPLSEVVLEQQVPDTLSTAVSPPPGPLERPHVLLTSSSDLSTLLGRWKITTDELWFIFFE